MLNLSDEEPALMTPINGSSVGDVTAASRFRTVPTR